MASPDKIRVLIVDDIAETREMIQRMLQFDNSIEVVGTARTGREAIEQTEKLAPDVAIMDINMPDMDGIAATEAIRKKVSFTQVVILSVQNDSNYMRRAMLVGARDFLTKPPMIDDLTAAIKRAGAMAQDERKKVSQSSGAGGSGSQFSLSSNPKGKVIVVYSPKGGNGATTISTNLAMVLQNSDTEVCLVDGNLQFGDVAVFLNEQSKNSVIDLTPRVDELDPEVVKEVSIKHPNSNLYLLVAPPTPEMAEKVPGEQFGKLLTFLRQVFRYVVVDTSSYLTDVVLSSLDVADQIILVTTQEIPAIKNANAFLTLCNLLGIPKDKIFFIMNRFDKKIAISPERVSESLKQEILFSIPFEERTVSNAINRGVPLVVDNKESIVTKAIIKLADMVKERLVKTESGVEITKK